MRYHGGRFADIPVTTELTRVQRPQSAMEASSYPVHPHQMGGQSPFFYYNPEPSPDHRQHGHFTPHPSAPTTNIALQQFQQQAQVSESVVPIPPRMLYSKPLPSAPSMHVQPALSHSVHMTMTPVASPRPAYQKPTIFIQPLDTECGGSDLFRYPSTPPLSTSGSSISSPPSTCGILPTPTNGLGFGHERFEGVKEGCESEVQSEILAGEAWTRSCSPLMTPGMHSL